MAENRQIREFDEIIHGTTASSNVKMTDHILLQHEDVSGNVNTFNRFTVGQTLCQPVAVTPNSTPSNGAYTATCNNFPDFAVSYTDKNGNSHFLIGMKVRVVFTTGITYGSTSANPVTYPTLNINGTGAYPLLAQGMTMGAGAASAGQSLELTLIPYGNSLAWDADTNVREKDDIHIVYTNNEPNVVFNIAGDKETESFDIDNLPTDIQVYRERNNSSVGWKGQDGFIVNLPWQNEKYGAQLAIDDESNFIAIRSKSNRVWNNWEKVMLPSDLDTYFGNSNKYISYLNSQNLSGYLLLAEIHNSSNSNHDCGFSGVLTVSKSLFEINKIAFCGLVRGSGSSVHGTQFTVNNLLYGVSGICDDLHATYETSGPDFCIRLYVELGSWLRYLVQFDGLYSGDVINPNSYTDSDISFPLSVSSSMEGTEITKENKTFRFPDYARGNLLTEPVYSYTTPEDCYVSYIWISSSSNTTLNINGNSVCSTDATTSVGYVNTFNGYVKKGSILTRSDSGYLNPDILKIYGLI